MKITPCIILSALLLVSSACSRSTGVGGNASDASTSTIQANAKMAAELKLDDPQDFADARRGFIARPTGKILDAEGNTLIDFAQFDFVKGKSPDTVNPSLWRHAILNAYIGLFKVTDGVYQLRGFDLANMTLIEGQHGWIVVEQIVAERHVLPSGGDCCGW